MNIFAANYAGDVSNRDETTIGRRYVLQMEQAHVTLSLRRRSGKASVLQVRVTLDELSESVVCSPPDRNFDMVLRDALHRAANTRIFEPRYSKAPRSDDFKLFELSKTRSGNTPYSTPRGWGRSTEASYTRRSKHSGERCIYRGRVMIL